MATSPTPPSERARFAGALTAISALLLLSACADVELRDPDFNFAAVQSFAWKQKPQVLADSAVGDDNALYQLERDVERELKRRGIREVLKSRADVVLSATLRVDKEIYEVDPHFSQFAAREVEKGTLAIEVFDRARRRLVWFGEEQRDLRTTRRAFGGLVQQWVPVDEPRMWNMEQMVAELLARLPQR